MTFATAHSKPPLPLNLRVLLPAIACSAFLTQLTFVPQIRNNVGLFEILGAVMIATVLLQRLGSGLRLDPTLGVLAGIVAIAALSQVWISPSHRVYGLIQVAILVFMLLFLLTVYNLALAYRMRPSFLLGWVVLALLVVGPWVVLQGGESIDAAGPFRNRAHMGSYMLTAFWMALILAMWPGLKRRFSYLSYCAIAFTLYAVAVSGRRSVYLALLVGLVALAGAFIATSRKRRARMAFLALFAIGILAAMYFYGEEISPRFAFFRERVGMIGERLRLAVGAGEEQLEQQSFFALQRQGVMMAFVDRPLVGIGWGGFPRSPYSPTGHEVHSTPMRFLAELGLVGLALYMAFQAYMLWTVTRLYLRMRQTLYSGSYLVLAIALWSLNLSYLYNRHVTERTFWLLVATYLTMRVFAESRLPTRAAVTRKPSASPSANRPQVQRRPPRPRVAVPAGSAARRARLQRRGRAPG